MTLEFEEFVRQFRARTAQRMVEFEAALAKAQAEVAKPGPSRGSLKPTPPPVQKKTPARRRYTTGQVQGVLKKS